MSDPTRPARLSGRTKARKQALDILFQADLMGTDPLAVLREARLDADPPVRDYAAELVEGFVQRRREVDRAVEDSLEGGWTLDRLARVDRCLARLATTEMLAESVPTRVAIAEALVLAGELSTDESPAFLNGVLAAVAKDRPLEVDEVTSAHEREADGPES